MSTKSSDVYREIQEILGSYILGIPMSSLSCLEGRYHQEFKRLLDYYSLGVNNIEELLDKMRKKGMVLFSEEPESKKTYVVCARMVKSRQNNLKLNVQELLDEHGGSIPLTDFEVSYKDKFKAKLDYHFFGLKDFDNLCSVLNLVVEAAYSGELVIKAGKIYNLRSMSTISSDVYGEIQKLIGSYFRGIPASYLSCLEREYQYEFQRSLDYDSLGVNNIEELLYKMRDQGMVLFSEEPESKRTYVMCARTLKGRQKTLKLMVQELLDENGGEIPLIDFEVSYKNKFEVQLDYHYFGLKDFDSLCKVLNLVVEAANSPGEKVLLSEEPESKKTHVMCARTLKTRQKVVKLNVQELLDKHGGSIPLIDFEVSYEDEFKAKLDYHYFGLKDFDSLCKVLNLVVEAANFPGEKVIKAGEIYNSRKRKK